MWCASQPARAGGTDQEPTAGTRLSLGERITAEVLDYPRTGLAAGMVLPDPADKTLETVRVTAHRRS